MSESFVMDVSVADSISPEPRTLKRPTLQLALKQQAKRRRRNTSIATQGNVNGMSPIPRVIVKVLPPLPPNEGMKSNQVIESEIEEVQPSSVRNATIIPPQTTMREVLASIPGFKTTKRTTRNLSAAAQIQRAQEGCVDLQNPSSILVKANLRGILNKHTFGGLPTLYQHKLIQLLPEVDRCPDGSARLSSTALSNEFFGRACQKWRDRLASGEFTPEFQQKIRAEAERDKGKLDPWKVKHFEPFWGCKGEPTAQEVLSRSAQSKTCNNLTSKRKLSTTNVIEDDETLPKKRVVGRRIGRRRMKRKKALKKIVISTLLSSEDNIQLTLNDTEAISQETCTEEPSVVESFEIVETEPTELIEAVLPLDPIVNSSENDEAETSFPLHTSPFSISEEKPCDQINFEAIGSNDQTVCHESGELQPEMLIMSDEPSTGMSCHEEVVVEQCKLDETDWGSSNLTEEPKRQIEITTPQVAENQETSVLLRESVEDNAFSFETPQSPTIKDSLPVDPEDEKIENKQSAEEEQSELEERQALSDFLDNSVGHFVEDSSPEDFFQSHQVTEALELLRDIHEKEDNLESIHATLEQELPISTLKETTSPVQESVSDVVTEQLSVQDEQLTENPVNSVLESGGETSSNTQTVVQDLPPAAAVEVEVQPESKTQTSEQKTEQLVVSEPSAAPSMGFPKQETLPIRVTSAEPSTVVIDPPSAPKIEPTVQQPTTVTLTLPFPVTLPLNLPLTLPISLPPGTTLVVSDPSTLVGLRGHTTTSGESGKLISSATSLTPIAPNKPRVAAASSSPSRILPRSSQPTGATVPVTGTSSTVAGLNAGLQTNRSGNGKQNQVSRAPPGSVNLERSYRICQAVIENSPNCEQLKAQLRPPSAFSNSVVVVPSCSPVAGNSAGPNRSNVNKNGPKSGTLAKSIKSNPVVKLTNQQNPTIGIDSKSVPLGTTSPSNIILVHPGTANVGIVDQQTTLVNKALPSSNQLQQPRQQLICIAPSAPSEVATHPSSKTPPANFTTNRSVGVVQQQLRPASTPPQQKLPIHSTIPQQAQQSVAPQPYQQQQQQTVNQVVNFVSLNSWPQQQQTRQQQQQQTSQNKTIAPAINRNGTNTQEVYGNVQQASSNSSEVRQPTSIAPRVQQQIGTQPVRQRAAPNTQPQQYASSNIQVNLQPMQQQQASSAQQHGIRQNWSGPQLQQQKHVNVSASPSVPSRNPVATPQTPPSVQSDAQLVSMGMSMSAQIPGNGTSTTPQLPVQADPASTENASDSSSDDAMEKSSLTSDCDCHLKAMIMCTRCGAFCHDDCIGPTQLCFTCIVP